MKKRINYSHNSYNVGQRVRIREEEGIPSHLGKIGSITQIKHNKEGKINYEVVLDHTKEKLTFPHHYLDPILSTPSSVLSNDLFIPWDITDPQTRFKKFTEDNKLASKVLETLLFYNHMVIPTVDYSIVAPLIRWLSPKLFADILLSHSLSFIRYRGGLGYQPGDGLYTFIMKKGIKESKATGPEHWSVTASRVTPYDATKLQINNRLQGLDPRGADLIAKTVELCTIDTSLPDFKQRVEKETYKDLSDSDILSSKFGLLGIDYKNLPGLKSNEVRIFTTEPKPSVMGDPIDTVIRLAMLNLEIYLADESGARDMITNEEMKLVIDSKIDRLLRGKVSADAFSQLVLVEGLPELYTAISKNEISLEKLWAFRNSSTATQFRKWFDEVGPSEPHELIKAYIDTIKSGGFWDKSTVKAIRFITVQAVANLLSLTGALPAALGVSTLDSFLLDKIRIGFQPRYFIDDMRRRLFKD